MEESRRGQEKRGRSRRAGSRGGERRGEAPRREQEYRGETSRREQEYRRETTGREPEYSGEAPRREQEYRRQSRREREARDGRRPGCLLVSVLTIAVITAVIAAAVFAARTGNWPGRTEASAEETARSLETDAFPGDEDVSDDTEGIAIGDDASEPETAPAQPEGQSGVTVDTLLETMSTEEKVLQLFMVTPEALTGVDEVYAAGSRTQEAIDRYPVGGIVYFKQNLKTPEQVVDMITRTQKYSRDRIGVNLLIGVDEEGGQVTRIGGRKEFGIPSIENMSEIGAAGDPARAYEVGVQLGDYLSKLGFNLDFAPVADVLTNPENTVVAKRSFGSDGAITAAFVTEEVRGLQSKGVSAVLKHFPGHGGTAGDSHEGYAYTERTLDELMAEDLVPFKEGIDAGARFVMAAHISAPNVTGDDTPASLSGTMITGILREKLGFDGVVITDALNMGAITQHYGSAEAAVNALSAGADMLLMPEHFEEAYNGVLTAVQDGTIGEERLNQSVRRILTVKMGA